MFRKVLAASTAALLVSLTLSVAPANAAVKNGAPCSKAGATTKSGGSTFNCTKYALVKNSKLTWRTTDCIKTVNAYLKTNSSVAAAKAETAKTEAPKAEPVKKAEHKEAPKAHAKPDEHKAASTKTEEKK